MMVFVTYLTYSGEQRARIALEAEQNRLAEEVEAEANRDHATADDASVVADDSRRGMSAVAALDAQASGAVADQPTAQSAQVIPLVSTTIRNTQVVAMISNGPALIESWKLLDFGERLPTGEIPIELVDPEQPVLMTEVGGVAGASFEKARFEVIGQTDREVVQRAQNGAGVLTRTIRLDEEGYGFDLELVFESARRDPVDASFELFWPASTSTRRDFKEMSLLAFGEENGVTRSLVPGVGQPGFLGLGGSDDGIERIEGRSQWMGFDIQYFAGVVIDTADKPRLDVEFEAIEPGESAMAWATLPSMAVGAGGSIDESLRGFLGPKLPSALAVSGQGLEHSVDRGWSWLEPLTRFFEIALDWLYVVIPNYGFAIIVLTILVRIFTAPLMVRQMKSAERMREVQPQLKELQERYKDDKQKQSEEMMKFYREEGVNPLAGCLPLILQFPVLIGLFYALRSSIGLRHAPFVFWIDDLSQPATLFTMPGVDFPVRVLPLIMGASMYVQQKMMPQTSMDPAQVRMMQIMMPGMMLLISYTFPSGLVLYWTVSNLLGIAHQYWIRSQRQQAS